MKIAFEASGIHYFGGGRTATYRLLEHLLRVDQENEYTLILSRPEPGLPNTGKVRQWIAPTTNRFLLRLWAQAVLPGRLKDHDLVHFSKNLGVFGLPIPAVVTVYDLTQLLFPEMFPAVDVWYWRTLQRLTVRQAARVIAISHNTAADVRRFYGVAPERVRVIYPACGAHFKPAPPDAIARVRATYGLEAPYVVHVGHLDRKKNLPLLVEAFAQFRHATGFPGKLALVGEVYPRTADAHLGPTIERLGLQAQVVFTGGVPDDDLPALYSGAMMAAFPSRHEGFGLVALEAMACGAPLITSAAGAVAEVVADAAVVLASIEPAGLAAALQQLYQDPARRADLRARGLERARAFSWEAAARETLALYREVVKA